MVRRRQLMAELKRLRENAGLTQDGVAERLDWHATKLMRIETGRTAPHPNDVRLMLDAYGITDRNQVAALAKLARDARQRGWWYSYRDVLLNRYDFFIGLEPEASSVRVFELAMIPGLLQIEEYARAVVCGGPQKLGSSEVQGRVEVRMTRQNLLARENRPQVWIILDESVIRRTVGGSQVMRKQLERLVSVSEEGRAVVQVIPYSADPHPGLEGPFVILGFADQAEPGLAYLETLGGNLYVDKTEEVDLYTAAFDHLSAVALSPDDTRVMLRAVADDLK
jgi:transcriptional regulator with XRE-family HTH domain